MSLDWGSFSGKIILCSTSRDLQLSSAADFVRSYDTSRNLNYSRSSFSVWIINILSLGREKRILFTRRTVSVRVIVWNKINQNVVFAYVFMLIWLKIQKLERDKNWCITYDLLKKKSLINVTAVFSATVLEYAIIIPYNFLLLASKLLHQCFKIFL